MASKAFLLLASITAVYSLELRDNNDFHSEKGDNISVTESDPDKVFANVYTECFSQLSFVCLQKKTLLYLKEINRLNEISVIGDYVKFVKFNSTGVQTEEDESSSQSTDELSYMIDKAIDSFFNSHLIRFRAMGKDVMVPNKERMEMTNINKKGPNLEEFVGRKKRKGGGGGGGDGGKKKMMMIVMMCMKMKLMMMLPAMMGMMGMMSFKGMMFSMMSFVISKMMLLMKILEKKSGGGGGGGGWDGGWAAGGGGGGAWMPAGGQDYGGGGYDANGQWQSRSIIENQNAVRNEPIITYVKPTIRYNYKDMKTLEDVKTSKAKSRKRRGLIDVFQNAYIYWSNKVLGINRRKYQNQNISKYKIIKGVKYVYYPVKNVNKIRIPKEVTQNEISNEQKHVNIDDFNKGEIIEGPLEGRVMKKLKNIKETTEVMENNPWQ